MREICTSGSEGGGATALPTPIQPRRLPTVSSPRVGLAGGKLQWRPGAKRRITIWAWGQSGLSDKHGPALRAGAPLAWGARGEAVTAVAI